jgi:hypothetical protein
MAKEVLNRGTNPNDGSGDSLRLASGKINNNFDELYNALGDGSSLLSSNIDFGNKKLYFSNTVETFSDLANISTSTYEGLILHVHDEGSLYFAHSGSWHKLLLDTSVTTPSNYETPLSNSAYSGSWDDLEDKPTIATTILDLGIDDGLAGQYLVTDGFGNFTFVNPLPGSYNDLTDKPNLFDGNYESLSNTPDLSVYQLQDDAFDGDYFSLTGRPNIPGDVNELEDVNNLLAGFSGDYSDLINTPDLSQYATESFVTGQDYATESFVTGQGYITPGDLSSYATQSYVQSQGFITSETDSQTLTLAGNNLSITNGNTVDLSSIVGDSVGNFTFASSIINTSDNSAITITPAVTTTSTLTVGTDLTVNNDVTITNDLTVNGEINTAGAGDPELFSESDILLTATDRVSITQSPFKLASFTDAERDALTAENGDMIYNTDNNRIEAYINGAWRILDTSPIV